MLKLEQPMPIRPAKEAIKYVLITFVPEFAELLALYQKKGRIKGAVVEHLACKLGLPWCCVFVAAEMKKAQDFS